MAREELITAIKNAIERGQSIQSAAASLISAGYTQVDVNEAAGEVNLDVMQRVSKPTEQPTQNQSQFKPLPKMQTSQEQTGEKPKKAKVWLIVLLCIIFLVLLGIVGLMIFGKAILNSMAG